MDHEGIVLNEISQRKTNNTAWCYLYVESKKTPKNETIRKETLKAKNQNYIKLIETKKNSC